MRQKYRVDKANFFLWFIQDNHQGLYDEIQGGLIYCGEPRKIFLSRNGAPALAQADIGIAIGAGTDVAIETAKVVLMKSDPTDIIRAIRLSKATVLKMKQNLFWASIYNLLAIPVAAGVLYPAFGISLRPEVAALLMSISSIIVAVNAVMLKRSEESLITV